MKIAIVGAVGEGSTNLINEVLFPALLRPEGADYGFEIRENGVLTAHRNGTPVLHIATFTHMQLAVAWLRGQ